MNIISDQISNIWNELDNEYNFDNNKKNQLADFIYQYKDIISNYSSNKNAIMSYAKRYGVNDLLNNQKVVDCMQKIAQLHCEQDKLINSL